MSRFGRRDPVNLSVQAQKVHIRKGGKGRSERRQCAPTSAKRNDNEATRKQREGVQDGNETGTHTVKRDQQDGLLASYLEAELVT